MSFDAAAQGNHREYPHEPYIFIFQKLESLVYIFAADSIGGGTGGGQLPPHFSTWGGNQYKMPPIFHSLRINFRMS